MDRRDRLAVIAVGVEVGHAHAAQSSGIPLLDTADMYGVGRNEELVGQAVRSRRHEVLIATKFGNVRAPDGRFLGVDGRPEYVRQACEARLRRLGVEEALPPGATSGARYPEHSMRGVHL